MTTRDTAISAASTTPETVTPDTTSTPASLPASTQKETFSRAYVAELRAENETWQQKHQKALAELDKVRQETQQQFTQMQQATRERIIRAEMKALALKAGLRDLDCLKLLDRSPIQLKDDDTLEGAQEALARLKEAKPYLFTEAEKRTSSSKQPPAPNPCAPANVTALPLEAYERSKRTYLQAI